MSHESFEGERYLYNEKTIELERLKNRLCDFSVDVTDFNSGKIASSVDQIITGKCIDDDPICYQLIFKHKYSKQATEVSFVDLGSIVEANVFLCDNVEDMSYPSTTGRLRVNINLGTLKKIGTGGIAKDCLNLEGIGGIGVQVSGGYLNIRPAESLMY